MILFKKKLGSHIYYNLIINNVSPHFSKALLRNALKLGLRRLLENNEEARHLFSLIMTLPLLPGHLIRATYREICQSQSQRIRRRFQSFFEYFERQWLTKVRPEVFSVHMLIHRTNNSIESYHKTLKTKLGVKSSIWIFASRFIIYEEDHAKSIYY